MLGRKTIGILWQIFERVVKTAFHVYIGRRWAVTLSDENLTISCSDIERKDFTFFQKVVWLGCQNCNPPGNRIILRRSMRSGFSQSFSDIEQEIFDNLLITYRLGCQNCILRVQKNTLSSITFAKKSYSFVYRFRTFRQKTLALWQKTSPDLSKPLSKCPLEQFEGRFFWPFLELQRKTFSSFSSINFLRGKLLGKLWRENICGKNVIFTVLFGHWTVHFRLFVRYLLRKVVWTVLYMSIGTIQGEEFHWNFFVTFRLLPKSFRLLSKRFCQVFQNWFLRVARKK